MVISTENNKSNAKFEYKLLAFKKKINCIHFINK